MDLVDITSGQPGSGTGEMSSLMTGIVTEALNTYFTSRFPEPTRLTRNLHALVGVDQRDLWHFFQSLA